MDFPAEVKNDRGYVRVTAALDCEEAGAALMKSFLSIYDKGKRTIVIDLSASEIINSYGIGRIMSCYKRLKLEDGVLLVKLGDGFIKQVFELLMLDKVLPPDTM